MISSILTKEKSSASAMIIENDIVEVPDVVDECVYATCPPLRVEQPVLCCEVNHPEKYHEAIVKKVKRLASNECVFYVTHPGMNSSCDRWVSKKDLMPDESRESLMAPPASSKKRKSDEEISEMTFSSPVSRRRRKLTARNSSSSVRSYTQSLGESCELPMTLRSVLDEERSFVTKPGLEHRNGECGVTPRPARRVHTLPASVTVKQVLDHLQNKSNGKNEGDEMRRSLVIQFCHELENLFDEVLTTSLLYPEELPQYNSMFLCNAAEIQRPCEVYGCVFLLRLFIRLPNLLQEARAAENLHGSLLSDLILLLQKNRQVCFRHSYREPSYDELFDWERAVVDSDNSSMIACIPSDDAIFCGDDDDDDACSDMAVTPTKKF